MCVLARVWICVGCAGVVLLYLFYMSAGDCECGGTRKLGGKHPVGTKLHRRLNAAAVVSKRNMRFAISPWI